LFKGNVLSVDSVHPKNEELIISPYMLVHMYDVS